MKVLRKCNRPKRSLTHSLLSLWSHYGIHTLICYSHMYIYSALAAKGLYSSLAQYILLRTHRHWVIVRWTIKGHTENSALCKLPWFIMLLIASKREQGRPLDIVAAPVSAPHQPIEALYFDTTWRCPTMRSTSTCWVADGSYLILFLSHASDKEIHDLTQSNSNNEFGTGVIAVNLNYLNFTYFHT